MQKLMIKAIVLRKIKKMKKGIDIELIKQKADTDNDENAI